MNKNQKKYYSVDVYRDASEALYAVSGMVLFGFGKKECGTKDKILRNFVARSAISIKSIFALWELNDFQNAWVIHRTILDRLFHLKSIGKNEQYEVFDDWSFYEQFKSHSKLKSDINFKHEAVGWVYELTNEQKQRIKILTQNKPEWKRPKAKLVAKDMGMSFLYRYGYDYASKLVHPMANDGQQDFFTITGIESEPHFPSQIVVLSNSVLVSTLILQEAINQSSFSWYKILYDFLNQVMDLIGKGDESYKFTYQKLSTIFSSTNLCVLDDSSD